LTDEKKKGDKGGKSKQDEKQHDHNEHTSSSGQQSGRSKKSGRSLFRTLSAQPTLSETDASNEFAAESHSESRSVKAATNALSVTARWGLNRTSQNIRPSTDKYTPAETADRVTESKNRGKNKRSNGQFVKLYESLDASVLRKALVSQKAGEHNVADDSSLPNKDSSLMPAASDQDLSCTDVPTLDVQSNSVSRRSSSKSVLLSCFLYNCYKG